ncbi:TPA: hypothetical protein ACMVBE_003827 [Clostridioides difficile]|nr:hypothetical protein [Clostridioides difficile]EQG63101.1 hypothetical protein QK3_3829 [Clostridioides difficile DA00145]MCW0838244.1 hypothetical protein [Clostridioides difficile]MCZ1168771.1 hypothetical protein [Clostridioides difficile]MCZ8458299.1 hypothetical protein [Clostridioides difficile]MCZ8507688.1 hypothetical protein [Clostridioides difficile]
MCLTKIEILKKFIEEYDVKTIANIQDMLKDLFAKYNSSNGRSEA